MLNDICGFCSGSPRACGASLSCGVGTSRNLSSLIFLNGVECGGGLIHDCSLSVAPPGSTTRFVVRLGALHTTFGGTESRCPCLKGRMAQHALRANMTGGVIGLYGNCTGLLGTSRGGFYTASLGKVGGSASSRCLRGLLRLATGSLEG